MVVLIEDHDMPKGWPLGLGNLNIRLQVTEKLQTAEAEPYSLHSPSSSFSPFSSLDTESTASFFQDHSISLGQLIGIRSRERVLFPNTNPAEHHENISKRRSCSDASGGQQQEMYQGIICVPLIVSILVKMTRSKNNSSQSEQLGR
ncbi:hypothetical protein U1Q18_009226 [Sarracenia purpurea var. burkii]